MANTEHSSCHCSCTVYIFLLVSYLYILFIFLCCFIIDRSILPESPRWLVSKQRYEDAELIFRHIAEKNKTHFDPETYQRFVREDKKVGKNK